MTISIRGAAQNFLAAALLLSVAVAGSAGCSSDDDDDDSAVPAGGESRFPACDPSADSQTLTFIHVNDVHANYNTDEAGESPVARMRGYFEQVSLDNPYTLFTNGGDDFEKGSVAEEYSEARTSTEITRALMFDARAIGNHDYAWGPDRLLEHSRDDFALVLASNTEYLGDDAEGFGAVEYGELQVGCLRVGFFSLVSMPWNEKNEQYDGPFFSDNDDFESRYDFAERARELVAAHREDVDVMVHLSHLGITDDSSIVREAGGIDVVLGAHTHTALSSAMDEEGVPIIQGGAFSEYIGKLDVIYDLTEGKVASYSYELIANESGTLPVSAQLQEQVNSILAEFDDDIRLPLAEVKSDRDEAGVAATAAAAIVARTDADAAFVDSKLVHATWSAGDRLTAQAMLDAFVVERQPSFTSGFNSVYLTEVTGGTLAVLRSALQATRWGYAGPAAGEIDAGASYALALNKIIAFNPEDYLPEGIVIGEPAFESETWRLLVDYAIDRRENCLYLDADEAPPDCE